MTAPWYVLTVRPGREDAVRDLIAKRGLEALCPHTRSFKRVGRQRRRMFFEEPVFTGYVFAAIPGCPYLELRELPFVSSTPLMMNGAPYLLKPEHVAFLRELVRNPPRHPVDPSRIGIGDRVRITSGPLQGIGGTVTAVVGRQLQLVADVLGRLTIAPHNLELASA